MRDPWIAPAGILVLAAACFATPARAGETAGPECQATAPNHGTLPDRSATLASLERMPDSCLKALAIECSDVAEAQLLDLGGAALCSMAYEALLRKSFGGSFHALLAWWRRERDARLSH